MLMRYERSNVMTQVDMWVPLQEMVEKCWVLWELMMLAQPLMVIAPSPGMLPQHSLVLLKHVITSDSILAVHDGLSWSLIITLPLT